MDIDTSEDGLRHTAVALGFTMQGEQNDRTLTRPTWDGPIGPMTDERLAAYLRKYQEKTGLDPDALEREASHILLQSLTESVSRKDVSQLGENLSEAAKQRDVEDES